MRSHPLRFLRMGFILLTRWRNRAVGLCDGFPAPGVKVAGFGAVIEPRTATGNYQTC